MKETANMQVRKRSTGHTGGTTRRIVYLGVSLGDRHMQCDAYCNRLTRRATLKMAF
jgi:hypothetical protein